jgi:molybdopterin-guanine dinucleotide biosynthesis protein A
VPLEPDACDLAIPSRETEAAPLYPPAADRPRASAPGSVQILLACHDSARFLEAQLESLLGQSFGDFTILAADDGSTDATARILADYGRRHPGRLRILPGQGPAAGPLATFARLLDAADADYVFFCDHDDVWLPDKIAVSLAEMCRAESERGAGTPILVHTDLAVVGEALEPIHPSAAAYANLRPCGNGVPSLLLTNAVCGCASLANRALCRRARPIPADAMMHDHWLALVAAAFGEIRYVPRATLLYRQHGRNAIGLQPWRPWAIGSRAWHTFVGTRKLAVVIGQCRQAAALLERFGESLAPADRRAAAALAGLWSAPRLQRVAALRRNSLALHGLLRRLALYYLVLASRPDDPRLPPGLVPPVRDPASAPPSPPGNDS